MKRNNRPLRGLRRVAPVFCSIAVLSTQLQAGPTVQLNGDESRDNMADSGSLGYVGANTRIGVSVDRHLQGQVDINQIVHEDDSSATSAEAWFGYKVKDDDNGDKGFKGGGAKLNHQWTNGNPQTADTVHKVFGAYDRNDDDQAKVSVGYGQEYEDLFWSAQVSKGLGDDIVNGDVTTRAYDYGVGAEVGTFFDSTLTRVRGGLDYEFGTDYADDEDRPAQATISAGIEQFFQDSPHSITVDVSGSHNSGGNASSDTDYNARLGYRYEFGGNGAFQSASSVRRQRVEIPGTPPRAGRAGVAAIPAIQAIAAQPARPAQAAIPAKYERRAVKTAGHEFVKTTMKLENETFFKLNSAVLTQSATRNLDKIVSQIRGHGYLGAVRITGNTCGMGDPVYDQRLSEKRANAVRAYLIEQGFNPEHLIARGLGKGSPKYDRNDQDFKNRRVDLEYVTERSIRQANGRKVEYKNVLVQEGRPATPAQPARPGRAGQAGRAAIPAIPASPGTPSRFVWKTESVPSAPIWIKRALHNTIKHNKTISTYSTRSAQQTKDDQVTINSRDNMISVLENDSEGVMLVRVSQPAHGTATVVGDKVRYIPTPGYSGPDSFTYTVTDRNGNEITSTVNVTVPDTVNYAPTTMPDSATTLENTAVLVDVLANDTDPDGDTLTLQEVGSAMHGTVQIVGTQVQYTPTKDYFGTDSFTYTVSDGNGEVITETVTITVTDVNLAPTPVNDTASTPEVTPVTITALNNDTDPDGDTLTLADVDVPAHGTAIISGNNIIYTPEADFVGTETFDYTVRDSSNNTATATVTVTVSNVNSAPVATGDTRSTPEDTDVTIDVLSNDSDPDGDAVTIESNDTPKFGTAVISGSNIIYTPNSGYTGTDSFNYTITDPDGSTATALVTVNVTNVNTAPLAADDSRSTPEDTAITIDVMSNDSDPDSDTISIESNDAPKSGTAVISGTNIVYTPNSGFVGTDTFTYTITDPDGLTSAATVTVDVTSVNTAPIATNDSRTTPQDTPITIDVMSNDSDPDGDSISIESTNSPINGTAVISGDSIVYTPKPGFFGSDIFDYTITDGNGGTQTATVMVTVEATNKAPTLIDDEVTTPLNTAITMDVLLNDSDPENDKLTITTVSSPTQGGSVTTNTSGSITYTPATGFTGVDTYTYTVSDGEGNTATANATVNVNAAVNVPPIAVDDTAETAFETPVTINVAANDSDPDGTLTCVTGIASNPTGGYVNILTSGTQISYTPYDGFSGTDSFVYTACDADGGTATATVTVTVAANTNQAPTLSPNYAAIQGYFPVTIRVLADDSDPDGDTLTLTGITTPPSNGTAVISGDTVIYTANAGYIGSDVFYYEASDGNGNVATERVDIDVKNDNSSPVVGAIPTLTASPSGTTTMDIASYLSDADGDSVYVAVADALGGVITFSGTTLQYTPREATISDTIYITVSDGNGGTADSIITVNIN
ncbi:Ig-like domain-containing protein [Leucothrix mucor]|uniref:Ig-like domain-containing protein n=1 Tax=Leucothrix mucor TaxID=45248 RepID=UPI0003B53AB8|nr:Ig-like domain-containing protein [Leucothrix mucor]